MLAVAPHTFTLMTQKSDCATLRIYKKDGYVCVVVTPKYAEFGILSMILAVISFFMILFMLFVVSGLILALVSFCGLFWLGGGLFLGQDSL